MTKKTPKPKFIDLEEEWEQVVSDVELYNHVNQEILKAYQLWPNLDKHFLSAQVMEANGTNLNFMNHMTAQLRQVVLDSIKKNNE